jgi:hypothetical protein
MSGLSPGWGVILRWTLARALASPDPRWTPIERFMAAKLASESRGTQVSRPREYLSSDPSKPRLSVIFKGVRGEVL